MLFRSLDPDTADLSGWLSHTIHDKIHQQLTGADHFGGLTLREKINAMVTSWLVGGSTEGATPCRVMDVSVHDDTLSIAYTGPSDTFDFAPATPADWPAAVPVMVAVKVRDPPATTEGFAGETATAVTGGGFTVTTADAVLEIGRAHV